MAMSTHQPFEDWLLSGATIDPSETLALQEHLQGCETCRILSSAWIEVEDRLRMAPTLSPAPGFTNRWEARMAKACLQKERRQSLYIFLANVGVIALLLLALSFVMLPVVKTPVMLVLAWVYQVAAFFSFAGAAVDVLITSTSALFAIVPAPLWVGIMLAFAGMSVVWIVAIQRLIITRRMVA